VEAVPQGLRHHPSQTGVMEVVGEVGGTVAQVGAPHRDQDPVAEAVLAEEGARAPSAEDNTPSKSAPITRFDALLARYVGGIISSPSVLTVPQAERLGVRHAQSVVDLTCCMSARLCTSNVLISITRHRLQHQTSAPFSTKGRR